MTQRIAVVTGGASGIGLAVARRLTMAGHAVALLDRDGPGAKQAAEAFVAEGRRAIGYEVDVADRDAVQAAFGALRKDLGPVGILVTSAGIESFDALLDITPEKWDRLIAVNLTGTFTCAQLAAKDMVEAGWGRIVTISSSSAQSGAPLMAHYVSSKGGVIGLTRALARELASHKITVNTMPGGGGGGRRGGRADAGAPARHPPDHRQHDPPHDRRYPHGQEGRGQWRVSLWQHRQPGPDGATWTPRNPGRHRSHRRLPVFGGRRVHHRAGHRCQWRHADLSPPTHAWVR
ncbi:MAG: SDR family oxidoreductase [Myxococcales bacterium]|nr:SDR family oxidoreductase [Myxococcales bacterium]